MATAITFIFRKFEGYLLSGIGFVGRVADENMISLIFTSGKSCSI